MDSLDEGSLIRKTFLWAGSAALGTLLFIGSVGGVAALVAVKMTASAPASDNAKEADSVSPKSEPGKAPPRLGART